MKKLLTLTTIFFSLASIAPVDARLTVGYYGRATGCPGVYRFDAQEIAPYPERITGGVILAGTYKNTLRCHKEDLRQAQETARRGGGREYYNYPAHISFLKYDIVDSEDAIRYISQVTGIPRKKLFFTGL